MAAPAGALGWRSWPFPLRIGAGLIAGLIMSALSKWLGPASIIIAGALWITVVLGVFYASGRLIWVYRYPSLQRLFEIYAPNLSEAAVTTSQSGSTRDEKMPARPPVIIPDISHFVGIEGVLAEIDNFIASRATRGGTVAPATLVVLSGPRGTGKSSVALALASRLHKAGLLPSNRIEIISRQTQASLTDSYGPSPETQQGLVAQVHKALGGALLIDDLDWIAAAPGGFAAPELGSRLLQVALQNRGRLFVIATGSSAAYARLDPDRRWRAQFNVRLIEFGNLSQSALRDVFLHLLAQQKMTMEPEAEAALGQKIRQLREEGSEAFDNAHAVSRLVDAILSAIPSSQHIVRARDIRDASPST